MKFLAKMAIWGGVTGLLISVFMSFFYDFLDILPERLRSPNAIDRDWDLIFFLWPSCILWIGNLVTGADLFIFVGVITLINAIRYSFVFVSVGILCNLLSVFIKGISCENSSIIYFNKKSIKMLARLSLSLFFVGIAAGFVVLISGYILGIFLPSLHGIMEQWGIIVILLFISPPDEFFWNDPNILFNVVKLILINGIIYSLAAFFIGIFCNMFYVVAPKQLTSS